MNRFASLASLAVLLAAPAAPALAAGKELPYEPGVYWEQTTEIQMSGGPQGFQMPKQVQKICQPKKLDFKEPPAGMNDASDDHGCKPKDVKRSGNKMTWKIECKNGDSGEGEITYGTDSYTGRQNARMQGRAFTIKFDAKKVGGDCDANEQARQAGKMKEEIEGAQAQQQQSAKEACEQAAEDLEYAGFVKPLVDSPIGCKDPRKLCANAESRRGLVILAQKGDPNARNKIEKLCKKDLAAAEKKHCAAIAREQEKKLQLDADTTEFVFAFCGDLAKALAKRECGGRSYTGMPPAQREFCTRWAQEKLSKGAPAEEPAATPRAVPDRYLKSGIPDMADEQPQPKKATKKKKPADEEDEDASGKKAKEPEDVKSRIMKGIFGR